MSNSSLVVYTKLSPNCNKPRNKKIDAIVVHHMAGNASVEVCGNLFANPARKASSNYGIGSDGRIALYCDEANRSWCSSSGAIDHRAITIEVANNGGAPDWHVSDKAFEALVALCTDICKRNGIAKLNYTGDKNGNLHMHKWYAATGCPGPYLGSKFPELANRVNANLGAKPAPTPTPAPVAKTNPYKEPTYVLNRSKYSKKSDAGVKWLQWCLTELGLYTHKDGIDGYFGPATEQAVKDFQKKNFDSTGKPLEVDGSVYTLTRASLNAAIAKKPFTASGGETVYIVKAGDTLVSIGAKYGKDYITLAKYNNIKNPSLIHVGDKIKIPK